MWEHIAMYKPVMYPSQAISTSSSVLSMLLGSGCPGFQRGLSQPHLTMPGTKLATLCKHNVWVSIERIWVPQGGWKLPWPSELYPACNGPEVGQHHRTPKHCHPSPCVTVPQPLCPELLHLGAIPTWGKMWVKSTWFFALPCALLQPVPTTLSSPHGTLWMPRIDTGNSSWHPCAISTDWPIHGNKSANHVTPSIPCSWLSATL